MSKVILSDVDGTITRGSLVLEHAVNLHNENTINLGDLPAAWAADKKNEHLIGSLAEAYRAEITGMTLAELQLDSFLDQYVTNRNNFYSILDRLIEERTNGARVVLISGSPNYLVKPFAKRFSFDGVGSYYHADETTNALNGAVDAMFHATAKRNYVADMNIPNGTTIHAYGDTASDVPLFEVAHHSVLVEPTNETLTACAGLYNELVHA